MSAEPVILVPYGVDPLPLLANRMLDRHAGEPPDLSRHIALFPQPQPAVRFRRALLAAARSRGVDALLPPWCGTLSAWLAHTGALPAASVLTPAARELVLLQALSEFPALTERFDAWCILDTVLPIFDELTRQSAALPAARNRLRELLGRDYHGDSAALDRETDWLYAFWTAWRTHLDQQAWSDGATAHVAALSRALKSLPATTHVYCAPDLRLPAAEVQWLVELRRRGQLTLLLQGTPADGRCHRPDRPLAKLLNGVGLGVPAMPPVDPVTATLDGVYSTEAADLHARARGVAAVYGDSPLAAHLALYSANDLEQEARAVELQVRRWWLAGLRDIAIITYDRKLARRVRALLERANIPLHDPAGWTLSTTSAATVLARWIECCEQDFAHRPLLDVLKSPFVTLNLPQDRYTTAVRTFEHDVIRRYRLRRGLAHYRRVCERRADSAIDLAVVSELLDGLSFAAEPLQRWFRPNCTATPSVFIENLQESLARLGSRQLLHEDLAGHDVLAALDTLRTAPSAQHTATDYTTFIRWFERELERRRFCPAAGAADVHLMTPAEASYGHYQAIALAGCTADHMPGAVATAPFLNESVRATLSLPNAHDRWNCGLYEFRRLLQAAPRVLITHRHGDAREPLLPSPWVEQLAAFHQLAYGPLGDDHLSHLLSYRETLLTKRGAALGSPAGSPAPPAPVDLLPSVWTASSHQRLVDCPYQFYAGDILGLARIEDVPDEVERSHYGERVHRILHAFHHGVPGLPGPFQGSILADRAGAETLLRRISHAAFAMEIEAQFGARAWYAGWQNTIPAYLDWLHEHMRDGVTTEACEVSVERTIYIDGRPLVLRGRIDRIDSGRNGKIVIDYKTGQVPDMDSIATGERVQLGFYALLLTVPVAAVLYLSLRGPTPKAGPMLTTESLGSLCNSLMQRMEIMAAALFRGARMPASGDPATCGRCPYEGVCRRGLWSERQ